MLNYLIFFLVLVINIFFELFFKDYELKNNKRIIIEQGMNLSDVSNLLKNNNIIKSKLVFKIWIKVNFVEKKIKFGEYQFENRVSVNKVVSKFCLNASPSVFGTRFGSGKNLFKKGSS